MQYFGDRPRPVSVLTLLYKKCIFDKASRVEKYLYAIVVGEFPHSPDICHAHRLAARHIYGSGDADICDILSSLAFDEGLEFVEIDVAFEFMQYLRVMCFVDDHIDKDAAG